MLIPPSGLLVGAYFVSFSPRTLACFLFPFVTLMACQLLCAGNLAIAQQSINSQRWPELARDIERHWAILRSIPRNSERVGRQRCLFQVNQGEPDIQVRAPRQERWVAFRPPPHSCWRCAEAAGGPSLRIELERTWALCGRLAQVTSTFSTSPQAALHL